MHPIQIMAEERTRIDEQQLVDLFQPGTVVNDFTSELDEQIKEELKKSKERQEKILKEKEVKEDLLRQVVKL